MSVTEEISALGGLRESEEEQVGKNQARKPEKLVSGKKC